MGYDTSVAEYLGASTVQLGAARRVQRRQPIALVACLTASGLLVSAACGAGAVRPMFDPFPEALTDTVAGEPEAIVEQLTALLTAEGLELHRSRASEGYVETRWFNAITGRAGGGRSLDTEAVVKLRFWADPVYESRTSVVGEAVRRRVVDPSLPPREIEAPVPEDHPAAELLRRILEALTSAGGNRLD